MFSLNGIDIKVVGMLWMVNNYYINSYRSFVSLEFLLIIKNNSTNIANENIGSR